MIHLAIFDIDGTIVDSVDLHAKAWQQAFAKFGKEISFASIRKQIGKGADQLLPVFFSPAELDRFGPELEKHRSELFKREYLPRVKAFPKVRELFLRIKAEDKLIALASSAKQDELDVYKSIAKIEDLVETETSSEDVEKSKPHSDVFAEVLARFQAIAFNEAIVVGDTPYDMQAAKKLRLSTVGFLSGGWSAEQLKQAGCRVIYNDPADLLESYDQSPIASK
jgi:HAD superfamily hydrolase (TIGR01549 family)